MRNFKKNRSLQERRTEIDERINEVEAELANTKSDILGNILPLKLLRKVGSNIKPMPMKVGAQLLATRMVSNSHPLIKVATPFVANSLFDKVSERENQHIMLNKAHRFFSWMAAKTKLSLREEEELLSAEIEEVNFLKDNPLENLRNINLEDAFAESTTLDAEKVDLY